MGLWARIGWAAGDDSGVGGFVNQHLPAGRFSLFDHDRAEPGSRQSGAKPSWHRFAAAAVLVFGRASGQAE
jgi:hypothetical protein